MKYFMAAVIVLAVAVQGYAQMLYTGNSEIGVSGLIDVKTPDGTQFLTSGHYGYYVADGFQVGGDIMARTSNREKIISIGPSVEADFDFGYALIPFVGGGIGFAFFDSKAGEHQNDGMALLFSLKAGSMVFISENVSLSLALVGEVATADVFAESSDVSETDARFELGLRYFF